MSEAPGRVRFPVGELPADLSLDRGIAVNGVHGLAQVAARLCLLRDDLEDRAIVQAVINVQVAEDGMLAELRAEHGGPVGSLGWGGGAYLGRF
jgi:hypothetical protein